MYSLGARINSLIAIKISFISRHMNYSRDTILEIPLVMDKGVSFLGSLIVLLRLTVILDNMKWPFGLFISLIK